MTQLPTKSFSVSRIYVLIPAFLIGLPMAIFIIYTAPWLWLISVGLFTVLGLFSISSIGSTIAYIPESHELVNLFYGRRGWAVDLNALTKVAFGARASFDLTDSHGKYLNIPFTFITNKSKLYTLLINSLEASHITVDNKLRSFLQKT